jgi:Xaa-Pro aminopeptidase
MHHQRLLKLRQLIAQHDVDGYIVPSVDPYQSEYPPACYRRLEWLTGFTGSMGVAVILKDSAAFFTDGRYTLQAKEQVSDSDYEHINSAQQQPWQWIRGKSLTLAYDPWLHNKNDIKQYMDAVPLEHNLIDLIWEDRPASPASRLEAHGIVYAGKSVEDKIEQVTQNIKKAGADACILTAPDSICWLLNIRGRDVPNTPLVLGYAIVYVDGNIEWFVENKRLGDPLPKSVVVYPQGLIEKRIAQLKEASVLIDRKAPIWFTSRLENVIIEDDPCTLPKACKNPIEIVGMRNCHVRDGAAVTKLLHWLDENHTKHTISEMSAAEKLFQLRKRNDWFVMPSFDTISGHGPNGAIVHYRATDKSNRPLTSGHLYLLDSGGQYLDGTTDITRTIALGKPSSEQKDRFTRVLKGHIALAMAVFPKGTTGSALDILARQYLWQAKIDYDHGTGHGVGSFLGVHEGPQRISKVANSVALEPGMILSNEPGYYKEGAYGIRIENLILVVDKGNGFYGFETLTIAPIDTRLIQFDMLSPQEKTWLENYHDKVSDKLNPYLTLEERAWLKQVMTTR